MTGGMGAVLMRKMGWREGEGLGKNKEGNKEPILVDFKTDRKGEILLFRLCTSFYMSDFLIFLQIPPRCAELTRFHVR